MAVKIALAVGLFIVICGSPGLKSSQVIPDGLIYTEAKKILVRGAQGVLTCRFHGVPLEVYWRKGLDPDDLSLMVAWHDGRVSGPRFDDGSCDVDGNYSLIINNVSTADVGRMYCTVSNNKGPLMNNYTDILVVDTAITTNPQATLQMRQATFGILQCTVHIKARRVSWKKGTTSSANESLVVIENNQGFANRSGAGYDDGTYNITQEYSLVINELQIHHEGLYVCEVTDDTGISFRNHTFVNVVAQPLEPFPTVQECINAKQHDPNYCILVAESGMTLTCQATKYYPSINLVFLYGSIVIKQSDTEEWENKDRTKNKTITIATRGNKELYTCVAFSIPGINANTSTSVLLQGDEPVKSTMVIILVLCAALILISSVAYFIWRKKHHVSNSPDLPVKYSPIPGSAPHQELEGQVGDHIPSLTEEEIKRVAKEVKDYLAIHLCQIQADPLNSELVLEFKRIFTNLTLMEEDKGTKLKTPLPYDNLLRTKVNGNFPKRLLVEGEGGVGKTTFCAKIAWDWIHGKGYQDFKLVLVILLRKTEGKTVGEIVKSYLSDNNPVTAKQLDKHILSNQKDVFLVLDGLDELAVDLDSNQQIALITLNRLFKSGTVLITSRQWRSDEIRMNADLRKVFAFIAVEGFSAVNLSSYITKFFHPDAASSADLSQFISNNDVIRENMAPYPIYTAMLCIMWKEFDGERREAMSKLQTFSQLFNQMIEFLVDHYLSKHTLGIVGGKLSEHCSDIRHHLIHIGCIAFQGLLERRLVFTEEEFQSYPESIDVGCKVGVLTREKKILPRRDRRNNPNSVVQSVQFPHKLFQEYLSGMYLASLYNSNRDEYGRLIASIIQETMEYEYLLYFTSAQQREVGLDINSRLIALNAEHDDDDFVVDVAYESQDQAVAKAVADHLSTTSRKTLKITEEMQAHTVSGHTFIMNHREVDDLIIEKPCGRTASEDLAEFMCSSRSLRSVEIDSTMHDVFYSVLANRAVESKIETLDIYFGDLSERSYASRDFAQFICKMTHLKDLTLNGQYHDDFYSTSSSMALSAKIETLYIAFPGLSERPSASRDLAQFIFQMTHLKKLTLNGQYHDDFYSTSSSMPSSAKIETLYIDSDDLGERPSASRDLAQFIYKLTHLKDLTLSGQYHDDLYSTSLSMASSAKIETLNIPCDDLSERPSASRDLAQFICKITHLKDLTLRGQFHDDFYSTSSSMASSAKIETLDIGNTDLGKRPSASRDLAQFICKMTHLKDLTLGGQYHDDLYSTSLSMASSAKIKTLYIRSRDLSERPSASRDLAQFICKMTHLKDLTLNGQYHNDFYSTSSSMASSAKSCNTSPILTELTVDDDTLEGWQDCDSMFDSVKRVTIKVWSTIYCDVIQRINLPGATELTIQTRVDEVRPAGFYEEPTSIPNALLIISPQLVKVTFSDLDIGNSKMELILQAFRSSHNLKHLKIIRFIRCGSDEGVDDVVLACSKDQVMEVEVEHGKPRGRFFRKS